MLIQWNLYQIYFETWCLSFTQLPLLNIFCYIKRKQSNCRHLLTWIIDNYIWVWSDDIEMMHWRPARLNVSYPTLIKLWLSCSRYVTLHTSSLYMASKKLLQSTQTYFFTVYKTTEKTDDRKNVSFPYHNR